jgi:valyl-tRNA synthetase
MNGCVRNAGFDPAGAESTLNRWILSALAAACSEVTAAIEAFRFNDAANAAYRFVWNLFCDWYLEFAKPVLQGEDGAERSETQATTAFVLDEICKLLHPFMPFITEELWTIKGVEGPARETVLALSDWPQLSALEDTVAAAELGWIIDLVSEVRSVRSELNVPAGATIPLLLVGADPMLRARTEQWSGTLKRLARLSNIGFDEQAPKGSVQVPVSGALLALPLAEFIDIAAESKRLDKESMKLASEAEKLRSKLCNPGFISKASEDVIEETRERLHETLSRAEKLGKALEQLRTF